MPPSRLLMPLCGLLLALAVTAVTAAAPLHGPGKVRITAEQSPASTTRDSQFADCSSQGGSLVPMVTDAVYTLLVNAMNNAAIWNSFSYMGASSWMLSALGCDSTTMSLGCIWAWDEGRYSGVENALAFFKGNRDPGYLSGAGMISKTVENHWRLISDTVRCPCYRYERLGAVLRDNKGWPYWVDTRGTYYSYGTVPTENYHRLCAIEQTTTTTPPPTPAPTTARPTTTTTTTEPSENDSGVNVPLVVGLSVAAAFVLIVTMAVIVSLVCCGGCCCGCDASEAISEPTSESTTLTASQLGSMSRRSCLNSGTSSNSHSSSFKSRGSETNDSEASQKDEELVLLPNSQYMQTPSTANMATTPPAGAVNVPTTMPEQMQPPQMASMQAPMAYSGLQTGEAPQPGDVHSPKTCGASMHRRSSRVTFVE